MERRGCTERGICIAGLFDSRDIRECIYPQDGVYRRLVMGRDLFVGLYPYLQEIAVFVFNGKGKTIKIVMVLGILVRSQLVQELPGGGMQRKHSQKYDSQYLM